MDLKKGTKTVNVHIAKVWHWNGKEDKTCPRTLVVILDEKSRQVRFSFSNSPVEEYSPKEYAGFNVTAIGLNGVLMIQKTK